MQQVGNNPNVQEEGSGQVHYGTATQTGVFKLTSRCFKKKRQVTNIEILEECIGRPSGCVIIHTGKIKGDFLTLYAMCPSI